MSCLPQAVPPRANWPHPTSLLPFHAASGTLSLGKMVAGNGLFVPQRQFIPGASHPLLRSEECLGKRAAGSWLSFALECNGRAAFKPHRPSCCQQETAHVLHRGLTARNIGTCSHKTLETPQTTACEHLGNPEIQKILECFLVVHVLHPGCDF